MTDGGANAASRPVLVAGRRLKHLEVVQAIEKSIREGEVERGGRLLSEHALAAQFNTSRGTIRRALAELAKRNLIATQTGRGSFVTFDGHPLDTSQGWTHALLSGGASLSTHLMFLGFISDPELAVHLGTSTARFLAVDRLRRLPDGSAVSLERSRIPAIDALEPVPAEGLAEESLTKTMHRAGLRPVSGEQWVQLVHLDDATAAIFEQPSGRAYLHAIRTTKDAAGGLVEHVTSILDPDHFRLHIQF
ncbi:GntR family transcriptional regulator [Gephyromycinifex aptenodytis]|uniref:GntR family transcriptional regulator n=1 Tax=Gephyromycinifex aptenodytis TaxID=2716227 RepID=UPI001446C765|nr:GntR family transcriptional regulator [Gephyromycinifex aptenodytis]